MMQNNSLINLKIKNRSVKRSGQIRFSSKLIEVLDIAARWAVIEKRKTLLPRHLLGAILLVQNSVAQLVLKQHEIDIDEVLALISLRKTYDFNKVNIEEVGNITFNKDTIRIFTEALKMVLSFRSYYLGTEHILLAILKLGNSEKWEYVKPILEKIKDPGLLGMEIIKLSNVPFDVLSGRKSMIEAAFSNAGATASPQAVIQEKAANIQIAQKYTVNLTNIVQNQSKQSSNFYIRQQYVQDMVYSLLKPANFNVLLIGPSGVGKTHLVYNLARFLISKDAPFLLRDKQILQLYLPLIFKDAKLPGDTEKQILNILNSLSQAREYILYIEDFGTIVNPLVRGGMSMASVFKSSLEFRNMPIIASMTKREYEQTKDAMPHIFRNFSIVEVTEPGVSELRKILKAYVKFLSKEYGVKFDNDVVDYTIKLVNSYIQDKVNPQKNIDIINLAVAYLIDQYTKNFNKIASVESNIDILEKKRSFFIFSDNFKEADILGSAKSDLFKKLEQIKKNLAVEKISLGNVTTDLILNVVAKVTELPVHTLASGEASMLLKLEQKLKEKIVSQEEAIKKVAYAVKRGRVGITSKSRPWASFLFLGPTGVGKTELAKVLARTLFGDDTKRLIQIDMSEYMEPHSVSKLIGSPPGYIGYESGGMLTRLIRENPYSVVLFDEIEKAHYDVLNLLLQILEEGRLRDSHGNVAYFNNTIIILTSNIGAKKIFEDKILGFYRDEVKSRDVITAYDSIEEDLKRELKKKLRPELLNRLDDVIIFRTLTKKDAYKILEILLKELNDRLKEKGIEVIVNKDVKDFLLNKGFSAEYGARQLRRTVQSYIENSLADYILRYKISFDPKNIKKIELSVSPDNRRLILKKKI